MRAVTLDADRVTLRSDAPEPEAGPSEALVRPTKVALGPADAEVVRAGAFRGILGRRFVGEVVGVTDGTGIDHASWIGRRVVASPDIACGACDLCRSGLPRHCRDRRVLGARGRDGALADAVTLPMRNCAFVPDGVDDDAAVFADTLAAAAHAAHIVRVEGKPYVTVLGDGAEGLLAAQLMARMNASVRVLGARPHRFGLAEKWGVKHRAASEVGLRADQDVVVEATGSPAGLRLALGLVRPRGKVVLMGGAAAPPPVADPRPFNHEALRPVVEGELELLGARGGAIADGVSRLVDASLDVLSLITKRMKLADGPALLEAAGDPDQIAVLVDI